MVVGLAAVVVCLYAPVLSGRFVFDDLALPFNTPARDTPLRLWMSGVRPMLMASYWLNFQLGGVQPYGYHAVNILIHCVNAGLVFGVLFRLLAMAGWPARRIVTGASLGALAFAIHPLQTESVSYVAGRSESLSAMFLLSAWLLYLTRRRDGIAWRDALAVVVLFGLAIKTKENAVSLAGILILTDLFWPKAFSWDSVRRNWRLYVLMAPGIVLAVVAVFRVLSQSQTAGFSNAHFKWYEYAFTESRAIFTYLRMAVVPVGQSLDHDFAISHSIVENGAFSCIALLAALVALSVYWRRRFPLFCFGLMTFLIWLAPTSSVVPLDDALVERRMYLPLIGLILIAAEFIPRIRMPRTAAVGIAAAAALAFAALCYNRNTLWQNPDRLIAMAAEDAIYNPRPLLNYTEVLIKENRCAEAPEYLTRAEKTLGNGSYYLNAAWGRALACLGKYDAAIERLQIAARVKPCSQVYEWLGLVLGEAGLISRSGEALLKAIQLDPGSASAHGTYALWLEKSGNFSGAEQEYQRAMQLDNLDAWARTGALRAHALLQNANQPVSRQP